MGSFSCASGSSASAPREMEEAARDRCAENRASPWRAPRSPRSGRLREGGRGGDGRDVWSSARCEEGRGTKAPAVRRAAARARDRSDKTAVRGAGRFRRAVGGGARTGEAVLAQDLRVEGAPGGLGGHASLAAERGGELAGDLGAALGHQRGVVIDAQHLQLLREGPAIDAVRLGATRALVVTSASRGALASRCERVDGSCASRSARRVAPSLLRGPAAAAILRIVRNAEPPKPSRRCFFCGSKFSREVPNLGRMDKQSAPENHKGYGSHPETNPHANATDCIGGPS